MRLLLLLLISVSVASQIKPSAPQAPSKPHRQTSGDGQSTAQKKPDSSANAGAPPASNNVTNSNEQQTNTEKMEERLDRKAQLRLNHIYVCATVVGVVGGWLVLVVLVWQNILTRRSVNVAKASLVSTFRPEIIIRSVALRVPWKIRYVIANRGGTRAHIIASNVTITDIEGNLPTLPPYSNESDSLGQCTLAPGDFVEKIINLDAAIIAQIKGDYTRKQGGARDPGSIHFLGYVQYRDDNGIIRYMAFCRLFDVQTDRFVAVNDPEYEYAD